MGCSLCLKRHKIKNYKVEKFFDPIWTRFESYTIETPRKNSSTAIRLFPSN
jgi:hypothetical protein